MTPEEMDKLIAEPPQRPDSPIDPPDGPVKTFTELLQEGCPHEGGLAQLAALEIERQTNLHADRILLVGCDV